jgi:hypothetical protein
MRRRKISFLLIALGVAVAAVYLVARAATLSVSDTFSDETKLGTGTTKVDLAAGQIKIAQCYSPNTAWTLVYNDTVVRDITSLLSSATVTKDIYCDNDNCILWTYNAAAPTTVCIATNGDVYGSILWEKTDSSTNQTWADSNFSINTVVGNVGGTHASGLKVGSGSTDVNSKNWLERFYTSAAGMFNSMDTCKAKGLGWRLPNILELDSIRDQAKGSSPYTRLPGIASLYYWSSSYSAVPARTT